MTGKPQQVPPMTCPYGNKAGLVIMALGITGRLQPKTGLALYEVHLPLENGKFKKQGKVMTLQEAGTLASEHEKSLGWDKLPARVFETSRPDPAVMAQKSKRTKKSETIEAGETVVSSMAETEASAPEPKRPSQPTEGQAGGSRARAQPKASERGKVKTGVAPTTRRRF
jgi:hypothetical protein